MRKGWANAPFFIRGNQKTDVFRRTTKPAGENNQRLLVLFDLALIEFLNRVCSLTLLRKVLRIRVHIELGSVLKSQVEVCRIIALVPRPRSVTHETLLVDPTQNLISILA